MSTDVSEKVAEIIAEQAMVEAGEVTPDTKLEDLGLDSLALVEVVFGIEEAFDITVPYNANDPSESDFQLETVSQIVDGVKELIAAKASA